MPLLAQMPRFAQLPTSWLSGIALLLTLLAPPPVHAQLGNLLGPSAIRTEQVTATLLAHAPQGVTPGARLEVGLRLVHAPDWHTYWKNPGDAGLATQITWHTPEGVTVGDIQWPTPKKFRVGDLANYGYDGDVLLTAPVHVAPNWHGKQLTITAQVSWLACRTECIPQDGRTEISIPAALPSLHDATRFEVAHEQIPKSIATNQTNSSVEGQFLSISSANLPPAWTGKPLEAFIESPNIVQPGAAWEQSWRGTTWTARLALHADRSDNPTRLVWVIAPQADVPHGAPAAAGVAMDLPVSGEWPTPAPAATAAAVSPALQAALKANASSATPPPATQPSATAMAWAILGAWLGGLLLNLMPCVFPVLAIKVLAFTPAAGRGAPSATALLRAHRLAGLAYTAGVVLSFLALGGLLVGLRAAGEQIGWGFQLQNPIVVAALSALFTLIGLNLAGVFDIGNLLPSSWGGVQLKAPAADAFLTGVLATAVASPCTAPFMGASLGLTLGLPASWALAVFASIGLGMSTPYLLASWTPAVGRWLPRPGPWMETFRQLMAFPMLATVVWLLWVLGQQTGINGTGAMLSVLLTLALLAWTLGRRGAVRRWLALPTAALLVALLWSGGPLISHEEANPPAQADATARPGETPAAWAPWSSDQVRQQLDAGRTVFVDFTAAWCVTCQVNKRTTLSTDAVTTAFDSMAIVRLRADWTRHDPAITAELARLGRNGVPTYAIYRPGQAPVVLSELISTRDVLTALGAR